MPYYSELGIYTPSSSYTSPLIKGPYSNHSSIIASNILPLPKQIHRSNFRGFKPHLTTISEANATAPLRRISSPKVIYHSSPKVRVQRPIKINTADIDVSVNKYNNYVERGSAEKRSPTSRSEPPPVQPEKEAKPNTNIRRDRATIRLQTIHKDALEKEIGTIKSWRDKFKPEELVTEARVKRKSPGEKLKEKFLIKSKSKEKIPHTETPKLTRRPSVKKSASFKDICNVITSDRAIEDLNPGQPIDIRRRQSRQVSHEDIIKEIERTSSNLSQEEVELLDALIKAENEVGLYETPPIIDDKPRTRKKKVTRKKTVEGLIKKTDKSDLPSAETDGAVKKSVSEGNVLDGASSKLRKDSSLQNMVKDISQVEIEMIPVKQKPIITGSVGDIDENAKSKLKLVVEDYQVHESPTPPKKEKKFRFNVTVEEFPVKKKIHFPKQKLSDQDYGVMHLPQAKPLVLNNLMKKNISKHTGTVTEEPKIFKRKDPPVEEAKMKKKLLKSLSEIQVRNKNDNSLQKSGSNDSMCSNFTVLVNKSKSDEGFTAGDSRTSSGKLKIISIEKNLTDKNNAAASLIKTTRKDLKENTFLSKGDLGQKKPQPLWAQRNKAAKTINITSSVEEKLKKSPENNLEEKVIAPETQSPFSDKLPEALDENKITLELKKSEPLLAPENKKEENVHGSSKEDVVEVDLSKIASTEVETKEIQSPTTKTTSVENTVTETLTLDVEKQASTVETKGTEIKEIQSPVSDKTTDGVLDENKQNKFLSKVDPQKKKPLWAQRNEAAKLLNKSKSLEDKVKETPILDVNKQAAAVEKKDDEIKEIQSPVSDKTTDGVLDENKQNKFPSKVDPQQKKPLWAQRNEAAKMLNKSKSLEDKVKETPILDVNKQAAAVEKKDDEIKEIQSPLSDKTTDGVLDENKQNKFPSKVNPQQKKPLWAQRNEAAKLLNKSKSLEDKVKETSILDVNKQAAAVEKKDDEIKEIQSPLSEKTTDGVLDENKQNKFLPKVILGLNKSTSLEDKIKETTKKAPAVDSLKTETKEAETKQIQSLDSDKLTEKVTPSVNNLIQNKTIMIKPDAGDKVAEEAVTATATSNQSTLRQNSGPVEVKSPTEELKPPLEPKQDEIKDLKNEKMEELVPQTCEIETKKSKEPKQPPETADTQLDDFWTDTDSVPYEPPVLGRLTLDISEPEPESLEEAQQKMTSKRSLIQKANKDDPDLKIFEPPTPPPQEPVKEPSPEPSFVPLQSNRLSQWMHPWKKPEQKDDGQVELFAKPKFIRARHIPRRWQQNVNSESEDSTTTDDEDSSGEDSEEDEDGEEEAEEEEVEDEEDAGGENKIGASTSSTDSGFESGRTKNKGSIDSRDSPGSTLNPASNPAFALDFNDLPEEVSQSSTYQSFQRSGRITPPATTIPRFRKYCVEDFNFLKVLGKGSFGKVLLAELKGTEYYYAVKCLKKDVVLEDDDVECTLIERKVLALGTKHPYLCHLLCTFQTESHLFFVMEYLNGGDLMFHIQMERRFSEARARFYGAEIVSGLRFLHNKGIVYRDLKLDNILLDFDGHVRIADFGMCKLQIFLDRMADTFCGTPDYMAPEIIKGQHYNQCVDWWSFGVLLYEMLLGQSPFSGCDEDELFWSICNEKPVIPRFLSAEATSVLTQFLEKDANKRLGNRFSPHGDIQDHPFFQPIDWPALEARKLEPPFKPNLQHPLDTQYFDKTFTTEKAKLTPIEGPILQSMDQTQFQGFSYTNPNATDK